MITIAGDGRFEILSRAGSGGQGTVYRARDIKRGRQVAIKRRPAAAAADGATRLLYDIPAHPALPIVREDFIEDGFHHLVTDWISGRPLDAIVDAGEPLDLPEALRILEPVAAALEELHQHGIVHADVKPANVIVTETGGVLVDLGSLFHMDRDQAPSDIGTPGYRAPELTLNASVGGATDVYGLAATMLAVLTGAPPGAGPFPALPAIADPARDRVRAAIESAMAIDPTHRPASPAAFLAQFGSLDEPGTLPQPLTSFVGRSADRARISRLVRSRRLVTLTGPPGVGKTRLAIEAARDSAAWFPGGAHFVDLAPARNESQLVERIAAALGMRPQPGRDMIGSITRKLAAKPALIVLDNCEHLRTACAALATRMVRADLPLHMLATSRIRLGADEEHVVEVAPLAIPPEDEPGASPDATAAVRLFTDRALAWAPSHQPADAAAELVSRIVRRLDGLPLAIELAAAAAAKGADLKAWLEQDHAWQPLDAAIEWSYELLTTPQRTTLDHASVFAGPFDSGALAAVLDDDPDAVQARLEGLVSHSLVARADGRRFRLLETVRDFARRRIIDGGREQTARDAHAAYFGSLARRVGQDVGRLHRARTALDTLDDRRDDLPAMFDTLLQQGRSTEALEIASALTSFWVIRGHWREGARILDRLIAAGGDDGPLSDAEAAAGRLAWTMGDNDRAETFYRSVLTRAAGAGRDDLIPLANAMLGGIALRRGEAEAARASFAEAVTLAERLGDERRIAQALNGQGMALDHAGDYAAAADRFERSLGIWQRIGDDHLTAILMNNLAVERFVLGDLAGAEQLHRDALALRRDIGDPQGVAGSLSGIGECAVNRGDFAGAERSFREALAIRRDLGDTREAAIELVHLGDAAHAQGLLEQAEDRYREATETAYGIDDKPTDLLIRWGLGWTHWASGEYERAVAVFEGVVRDAAKAGMDEEGISARHGIARVVLDRDGPTSEARAILASILERRLAGGRLLRILNVLETAAASLHDPDAAADVFAAACRARRDKGMPRRPVHEAFVRRHLPGSAFNREDAGPDVPAAARIALAALRNSPE